MTQETNIKIKNVKQITSKQHKNRSTKLIRIHNINTLQPYPKIVNKMILQKKYVEDPRPSTSKARL